MSKFYITVALIIGTTIVVMQPDRTAAQKRSQRQSIASSYPQSSTSLLSNLFADHTPMAIGVDTHSVGESLTAMQQMFNCGIRVIRTDLSWNLVETSQGQYIFSDPNHNYDQFVARATTAGLTVMFILDYSNPLYDNGYSPFDDAGRAAYTNYALAAVTHFRGKGIIWEVYNEPLGFWTPTTTYTTDQIASLYNMLASQVVATLKATYPNEIVIGPAEVDTSKLTSGPEYSPAVSLVTDFYSQVGAQVDGISIHPYRPIPESEISGLSWLYALSNKSSRVVPVVSSEWGYSSTWYSSQGADLAEDKKAEMIVRSLLSNVITSTNLSVIYEWMDDASNTSNDEDNYGLTYAYSQTTSTPTIIPTAAYTAVKTFWSQLAGYTFAGRVQTSSSADYLLRFVNSSSTDERYVCWTQNTSTDQILVPVEAGSSIVITDMLGNTVTTSIVGGTGYSCSASGSPQYISYAINKATVAITVSSATNTPGNALSVVIDLSVIPSTGGVKPSGSVSLTLNGTFLGESDLSKSGSAQITLDPFPTGSVQLTASYSGDAQYAPQSQSFNLNNGVISPINTPVITAQASTSHLYSGQPVTINISVAGTDIIPTGFITVSGGGYSSSAVTLQAGNATLTIPANSLQSGQVNLEVAYSGDSHFASVIQSLSVTVAQSLFTLTANLATPPAGATAAWSITAQSSTAYSGSISLSCSVIGSSASYCAAPAQTLKVGDTVIVYISTATVSRTSMLNQASRPAHWANIASGEGALLLSLGVFWGFPKKSRRIPTILLFLTSIQLVSIMSACNSAKFVSTTTSGPQVSTQVNIQGIGNPTVTPIPSLSLSVGQ